MTRRHPRPWPPDPLQADPPASALLDPSPADARDAARVVARAAGLGPRRTDDLLVVVSELVTNAIRYGRPPVAVELWREPGRVVVAVGDAGPGPADPLVGLTRQEGGLGGLGLWMAHQLADRIALEPGPDGFTARASVAGAGQRSSRS